MAQAYILVRKSDNRVVGVNKEAINPAPAAPREEFFEEWIGVNPNAVEIFRTGVDAYNNTGVKIRRTNRIDLDNEINTDIDGAADLAALKTVLKRILRKLRAE